MVVCMTNRCRAMLTLIASTRCNTCSSDIVSAGPGLAGLLLLQVSYRHNFLFTRKLLSWSRDEERESPSLLPQG